MKPKHQSGQYILSQIYKYTHKLKEGGNRIVVIWVPSQGESPLKKRAKAAAKAGTEENRPQLVQGGTKATILGKALRELKREPIPSHIGKFTTDFDKALPGKHVRRLYDNLKRPEASILAQLRTGMARLNEYLYRIGASETDQCPCGQATESIKHFLFRCTRWNEQRRQLFRETNTRRGCLSYFLGGRSPSDRESDWAPNMSAVRATIKYVKATERFQADPEAPIQRPEEA
jgi:hypothetical protein